MCLQVVEKLVNVYRGRALVAQASGPGFDPRRLPGFFLFQLALGCRWGDESVCAHPC